MTKRSVRSVKLQTEKVHVNGKHMAVYEETKESASVSSCGWLKIFFIIAVLAVIIYAGSAQPPSREKISCSFDDECIGTANANIMACRASDMEFAVKAADGGMMVLYESVIPMGSLCVIYETVKNIVPSGDFPEALANHSRTCRIPMAVLESRPYTTSLCTGFLYDYLVRYGPDLYISGVECSGSQDCIEKSLENLKKCEQGRMVFIEKTASGYWTKYMAMAPASGYCAVYFEIVNAAKMPLSYDSDKIGLNMTCYVPDSALPAKVLNASLCEGSLYDYLWAKNDLKGG